MTGECFLCGRPAEHIHHIFSGTANRKNSEKWNCTMPLCANCHELVHNNADLHRKLKQYGERRWLKETGKTIEEFIKIFGKNWLGVDDEE